MSAMINLIIILAGVGFGTVIVGMLSDGYTAAFGEEAIRYSLLTMTLGLVIGAFAAAMAARSVLRSRTPAAA